MIHFITDVRYLARYKLQFTFDGKYIREVDLEPYLDGEIFEPLKDINYFKTVYVIPEIETIVWDNGADYAPEFLFEISVPPAKAASAA
jgi:hypothetical protein